MQVVARGAAGVADVGNDLPGFFYNWVASFMTLIFGGIALLVICFIIGDRLYFRRLKPWLEN